MKTYTHLYKNGAKIIYIYDKNRGITENEIIFKVGAVDEKKKGALHCFEHMVFKSTLNMSDEQRKTIQNQLCSNSNAYTSMRKIMFDYDCLNEHFEKGFSVFAEGITMPKFDREELRKEKMVILQELSLANSMPEKKYKEKIFLDLHTNKPYKQRVIGTKSSIKSITVDDLNQVKSLLTPDKMFVVGIGGIKFKKYKQILEKNFQKFLFNQNFTSNEQPLPCFIEKPKYIVKKRKGENTKICIYINNFTVFDHRVDALRFFQLALRPRLYSEIRTKLGLVYQIHVKTNCDDKGGRIEIDFSSSAYDVKKILSLIKNEIKKIAEHGLTEIEFERGRIATKREIVKWEDPANLLNKLTMDQILYGRIRSKKEIEKNAYDVDNEKIKDLARYIIENKSFIVLGIGTNIKMSDLKVFEK